MNFYQAVLFDLDGTLVDTAPDMCLALNLLLERHDKRPMPFSMLRAYVSHGSAAMVMLGFGVDQNDARFLPLRDQYLDIYEQNIAVNSSVFDGMESILDKLDLASIPWGIVTNKPGYLTAKLLLQLDLHKRAASVISGDTLALRKPHPEPLLKACADMSCNPLQCLYVGDAERDIEAAKAAGMVSCSALYGYYTDEEDPAEWNADFSISAPSELSKYISFNHR